MKSIFISIITLSLINSVFNTNQPPKRESLRWESAHDGYIPTGALLVGHISSKEAYFARVTNDAGIHIGYITKGDSKATFSYEQKSLQFAFYEVLIGTYDSNVTWVDSSSPQLLNNALKGGEARNGETLYIGWASFKSNSYPGQYHKSWHGLRFSDGQNQIEATSFQLLSFSSDQYEYQYNFYESEFKRYKLGKLSLAADNNKKEHQINKAWMGVGIVLLIIAVFLTIAVVFIACKITKMRSVSNNKRTNYHSSQQENEARGEQIL